MGVYQYTFRTETKIVDGIEIGIFKYAWKHCWGASTSRYAKIASTKAERARDRNANVKYAVVGDFKYAETERLPVYETDRTEFADGGEPGKLVGYLTKTGRKFIFKRN
jgi:hypothetical protein